MLLGRTRTLLGVRMTVPAQVTIEEAATPKVVVRPSDLTTPSPSMLSESPKTEGLRKDWRCARRCGIVIPKGTDPLTLDWLPRGGWAHLNRCPTQQSLEEAAGLSPASPPPAAQAAPEQPEQPEQQPEARAPAYVRVRVQKVELNPTFLGSGFVVFRFEPAEGFDAAFHAEQVPRRGRFGQEKRVATEADAKALAAARGWELP